MSELFQFDLLDRIGTATVLILLIKFTLLLLLVMLIYRFALKRSASFRHAVLMAGILFMPMMVVCHFLIHAWSVPLPGFLAELATNHSQTVVEQHADAEFSDQKANLDPSGNFLQDSTFPNPNGNPFDSLTSSDQVAVAKPQPNFDELFAGPITNQSKSIRQGSIISVATIAVCAWLLITSLLLIRVCIAWLAMSRKVRLATLLTPVQLTQQGVPASLVEELDAQKIRIKSGRSRNQMPLGVGLFRKTILLPNSCKNWTPFEWRSVLLHEKAHFDRGDCWANLAARIQQAILWFHPLSNKLVRMIRDESEFACDDRVIESGLSRIGYAEVLLQFASQGRYDRNESLVGVAMSDSAPLASRMNSILSEKASRRPTSAASLVALSGFIALMLAPVATAQWLGEESEIRSAVETDSGIKPVQEVAEEENLFNVSLLPNEGDVSYSGEFVGTSEDTLTITVGDAEPVEIDFADVDAIFKLSRSTETWSVRTTEGKIHKGTLENESIFFTVDADHVEGNADMGRAVSPEDIYLAVRIRKAELQAGTITDGVATSKLSYYLRAPANFDESKPWPAITLLHQAGRNGKQYIEQIVETWPEIADRYVLIGLNGERPNRDLDNQPGNPSFFYTGLSYVGNSSGYRPLPGTDRESPAPIAEAITELRNRFQFSKLFVAGHGSGNYSAGGNNAFHIQTFFPEVTDGVAVFGGASLIQCDVAEFNDEELRKQQRATPLVMVEFEKSYNTQHVDWIYSKYLDNSFPMVKYMQVGAGNDFTDMCFDQAIAWLENMTVDQPEEALGIAERFVEQGNFRDAMALVDRLLKSELTTSASLPASIKDANRKAMADANRFLECIENGEQPETWMLAFFEFRKTWEFAPASQECIAEFQRLRSAQNAEARILFRKATDLDREASSAIYKQLANEFYASRYYHRAMSILDSRKKQK